MENNANTRTEKGALLLLEKDKKGFSILLCSLRDGTLPLMAFSGSR
jgi:hypothetical protein